MRAKRLLILCCFVISFLYTVLSVVRHAHFQSGGYDLGIYDQIVWKMSRGETPYSTIQGKSIFADHLPLTLYLLSPLYRVWSDARVLLIFQAFWLTFSAYPVFLLARYKKLDTRIACGIAVSYSLFYGIQYAVYDDFHPVILGAGMMPWVLYYLLTGKRKLAAASVVFLLFSQENMGIELAIMGMLFVFNKQMRRTGVIMMIAGMFYSAAAAWIISEQSTGGYLYYPRLPRITELFSRLIDHADKRTSLLYTFTSFGFLPFLNPAAGLAAISGLSVYFLAGDEFVRTWSAYVHYRVTLAPVLAYGTIETCVWVSKHIRPIYIAGYLVLATAAVQCVYHLPLNKLTKPAFYHSDQWIKDNHTILSHIQDNWSVAAQQNLLAHVSGRSQAYLAWPRQHEKGVWWLDIDQDALYLLVDTRKGQWLTQTLESDEHFLQAVENMETQGAIVLEQSIGSARLYRILK